MDKNDRTLIYGMLACYIAIGCLATCLIANSLQSLLLIGVGIANVILFAKYFIQEGWKYWED